MKSSVKPTRVTPVRGANNLAFPVVDEATSLLFLFFAMDSLPRPLRTTIESLVEDS